MEINIKNIKNITEAKINMDSKIINIIAVNNKGKTNILQSIVALFSDKQVASPEKFINRNFKDDESFIELVDQGFDQKMKESFKNFISNKISPEIKEYEIKLKNIDEVLEMAISSQNRDAKDIEEIKKNKNVITNNIEYIKKDSLEYINIFDKEYPTYSLRDSFHRDENGKFVHSANIIIDDSSQFHTDDDKNYGIKEWLQKYLIKEKYDVIYESDFSSSILKDELILDKAKEEKIYNIFKKFNIEYLFEKSWVEGFNEYEIRDSLAEASKKMTEYFLSDWVGEELKFNISILNINEKRVSVEIINSSNSKKRTFPSEMSQGFIWKIALKTLLLNCDPKKNTIILLDEPSNFLHITAQQELVKFLENFVKENNNTWVIYTTHSPFMISKEANVISYDNVSDEWKTFKEINYEDGKNENLRALIQAESDHSRIKELIEMSDLVPKARQIFDLVRENKLSTALTNVVTKIDDLLAEILIKDGVYANKQDFINSQREFNFKLIKEKNDPNINDDFIDGIKKLSLLTGKARNSSSDAHTKIKDLKEEEYLFYIYIGIGIITYLNSINK